MLTGRHTVAIVVAGDRVTDEAGPINLRAEAARSIGGLRVDPAGLRVVAGDGQEASLQPRVMQVLVALLRAQSETLSRDDLLTLCWDGRIVSDDAIERAVAQLRKTLQDIGAEGVRIETITSIGYRLRVASVDAEVPRQPPSARGTRRNTSPLIIGLGVLGLLIILGAGAMVFRLVASRLPHAASVELLRFEVIGDGVAPDIAMRVDQELRSALGKENAVIIKEGDADYRLQGSLQRIDGDLRYATQLVSAHDSATAWSMTWDLPITSKVAARHVALTVAVVVHCGLTRASEHPVRLSARALSLLLSRCDVMRRPGGAPRSLDLSRQMTAETPGFARGWSARAIDAGVAMSVAGTEAERATLRQEADQAASRALRIDPKSAEAWSAKASLLSRDQLIEKEAMRRRALVARPSDCGCEHEHYGKFLMSVGRTTEAIRAFGRAYDMAPISPSTAYALASSLYAAGRGGETASLRAQFSAYTDEQQLTNGMVRYGAMRAGRWAEAGRLLDAADRSERNQAFGEAFAALISGEAGRISKAGERLARIGRASPMPDPNLTQVLAVLGDRTDALEALERLVATNRLSPPQILFDPLIASLWEEPRYVALLEKAGLVTYWRKGGRRPDVCGALKPPGYCRDLAQSSVRR